MIEVVCGFRSAISSDLTAIRRPSGVGEDERPVGRLLEQDAGEDRAVGPRHAPGDELGCDLPAGGDDRLDQPTAVGRGRQGRQVGPGVTASAVDLVAAIAARPLGMEEDPLAGRRVGRSFQPGEPGVEVGGCLGLCRSSPATDRLQSIDQLERRGRRPVRLAQSREILRS